MASEGRCKFAAIRLHLTCVMPVFYHTLHSVSLTELSLITILHFDILFTTFRERRDFFSFVFKTDPVLRFSLWLYCNVVCMCLCDSVCVCVCIRACFYERDKKIVLILVLHFWQHFVKCFLFWNLFFLNFHLCKRNLKINWRLQNHIAEPSPAHPFQTHF